MRVCGWQLRRIVDDPGDVVVQAAGKCAGPAEPGGVSGFLEDAPGVAAPPVGGTVGGLFGGTRMWGAVVNRDGELCIDATNQADPTQVWPGSQAIAKAKAYTANAFSLDSFVLSTARLYTLHAARAFAVEPRPIQPVRPEVARSAVQRRAEARNRSTAG